METSDAVTALAALAHPGRLAALRLLVRAGPDGLPAGQVARALGIPPSTLSSNLAQLSQAGLVTARRDGRRIVYAAAFDRMAALLAFLTDDCCNGDPAVCAPLAAVVRRSDCQSACRPTGARA